MNIRMGKTTRVHVTGWQSLFAGLPSASYYLTVTLTDASGNTAFVVSSTTV
jgi:hypothetical protein